MRPRLIVPAIAMAAWAGLLAACGTLGPQAGATAELAPTGAITPNPTLGKVTFTTLEHGVRVKGEVRGFAPGTSMASTSTKRATAATTATPRAAISIRPAAPMASSPRREATRANCPAWWPTLGVARFSVDVHNISLTEGAANNVIGRALVVHRDRDDFTTQPAGNSGPRIACGIISRS